MENYCNKGSLTSVSGEILNLNKRQDLQTKTETISSTMKLFSKLSETVVTTDQEIDNNASLTVKEEPEDLELPLNASMETKIISPLLVKMEPNWDQSDIELLLKHPSENENTLDIPDRISIVNLDGFRDIPSKYIETPVKIENYQNETGKICEIFLDEWREEPNEISTSSGGTKQQKINSDKKHKCHLCEYRTNRKYDLQVHFLKHQDPDEVMIKCDECDFKTIYKKSLKIHKFQHKKQDEIILFKCSKCNFKSDRKGSSSVPLQHKRRNDRFKCSHCNFKKVAKPNLRKPAIVLQDPDEMNVLRCDKCDFETIYKRSLKLHHLRHEGLGEVETFKCSHCDYKTIEKSNLRRHVLVHRSSKKIDAFQCDKCEFKTIHKGNLTVHSLRHKPPDEVDVFMCDQCSYKSIYKGHVMRHHRLRHRNSEKITITK